MNDSAIFFSDQGTSSQRELNEHSNFLLCRDGLSKAMDFRETDEAFIPSVASKRNHIPRKSLNYRTPEMLQEYKQLKSEYGNVDLISKNLDPSKMTNEEKEFLNKVIELAIKEAVENGMLTSVSEKEAREQIYGLMTGILTRNGHGAINIDVLGVLINGLINVIGFALVSDYG